MANTYIGSQFSGPVIQAMMDAILGSFQDTDDLVNYWKDLDLATAVGGELDFMGALAGFPRPLVPETFYPGTFEFGDSASFPHFDTTKGLGDSTTPGVGGILGSAISQPMDDANFRLLIPIAAILKYYGLTIYSVDLLAHWTGVPYTIGFTDGNDEDILLTFATEISTVQIWILTTLFDKYATEPTVVIVNP